MPGDTPQRRLMYTLQALALPAEAQSEYVPDDRSPSMLIGDFNHWLSILQGRDDWAPTHEQQDMLARMQTVVSEVKEPKILEDSVVDSFEALYTREERSIQLARAALDNAEWQAFRECSRDILAAFGWECVAPPELDLHAFKRLEKSENNSPSSQRESALVQLSIARRRPDMYCRGGIEGAQNYLNGYSAGVMAMLPHWEGKMNLVTHTDVRRGWEASSIGPVPQMQERGWSEAAIIDELITIEIEALGWLFEDEAQWGPEAMKQRRLKAQNPRTTDSPKDTKDDLTAK